MSAHFTHRRHLLEAINQKSQVRTIDRPHITGPHASASAFQVTLLIGCVLLLMALIVGLVYSGLNQFQWFRNLIDPEARMRYNEERAERTGLMAGREIGGFARGFGRAITPERSLLCDRSGYLGGGRGYGWRTQAYGDGVSDTERRDGDSGHDITGERKDRGRSVRSIRHRDDCEGHCGLASRRSSRDPSPERQLGMP